MLITKSLKGTPPNSQSKIRKQIIFIFIACFLYSFICILINSLSELGISPAYSHCMGDENFAPNKKILIFLVILPVIVLVLSTLRIEYKTAKMIKKFKKSSKYQELMKEKNFSLLIIIGEETSLRSTVVNIGVLISYIIVFVMFSLSMKSQPTQLERLMVPPVVTWLLKEPLILFWASYVSKTNLTSIQKDSKKDVKDRRSRRSLRHVIRTDRYLDLLANNPFLEPVPIGRPKSPISPISQQVDDARPKSPMSQQVEEMERERIEARRRFDLSVKRFEDAKKHVHKKVEETT